MPELYSNRQKESTHVSFTKSHQHQFLNKKKLNSPKAHFNVPRKSVNRRTRMSTIVATTPGLIKKYSSIYRPKKPSNSKKKKKK